MLGTPPPTLSIRRIMELQAKTGTIQGLKRVRVKIWITQELGAGRVSLDFIYRLLDLLSRAHIYISKSLCVNYTLAVV